MITPDELRMREAVRAEQRARRNTPAPATEAESVPRYPTPTRPPAPLPYESPYVTPVSTAPRYVPPVEWEPADVFDFPASTAYEEPEPVAAGVFAPNNEYLPEEEEDLGGVLPPASAAVSFEYGAEKTEPESQGVLPPPDFGYVPDPIIAPEVEDVSLTSDPVLEPRTIEEIQNDEDELILGMLEQADQLGQESLMGVGDALKTAAESLAQNLLDDQEPDLTNTPKGQVVWSDVFKRHVYLEEGDDGADLSALQQSLQAGPGMFDADPRLATGRTINEEIRFIQEQYAAADVEVKRLRELNPSQPIVMMRPDGTQVSLGKDLLEWLQGAGAFLPTRVLSPEEESLKNFYQSYLDLPGYLQRMKDTEAELRSTKEKLTNPQFQLDAQMFPTLTPDQLLKVTEADRERLLATLDTLPPEIRAQYESEHTKTPLPADSIKTAALQVGGLNNLLPARNKEERGQVLLTQYLNSVRGGADPTKLSQVRSALESTYNINPGLIDQVLNPGAPAPLMGIEDPALELLAQQNFLSANQQRGILEEYIRFDQEELYTDFIRSYPELAELPKPQVLDQLRAYATDSSTSTKSQSQLSDALRISSAKKESNQAQLEEYAGNELREPFMDTLQKDAEDLGIEEKMLSFLSSRPSLPNSLAVADAGGSLIGDIVKAIAGPAGDILDNPITRSLPMIGPVITTLATIGEPTLDALNYAGESVVAAASYAFVQALPVTASAVAVLAGNPLGAPEVFSAANERRERVLEAMSGRSIQEQWDLWRQMGTTLLAQGARAEIDQDSTNFDRMLAAIAQVPTKDTPGLTVNQIVAAHSNPWVELMGQVATSLVFDPIVVGARVAGTLGGSGTRLVGRSILGEQSRWFAASPGFTVSQMQDLGNIERRYAPAIQKLYDQGTVPRGNTVEALETIFKNPNQFQGEGVTAQWVRRWITDNPLTRRPDTPITSNLIKQDAQKFAALHDQWTELGDPSRKLVDVLQGFHAGKAGGGGTFGRAGAQAVLLRQMPVDVSNVVSDVAAFRHGNPLALGFDRWLSAPHARLQATRVAESVLAQIHSTLNTSRMAIGEGKLLDISKLGDMVADAKKLATRIDLNRGDSSLNNGVLNWAKTYGFQPQSAAAPNLEVTKLLGSLGRGDYAPDAFREGAKQYEVLGELADGIKKGITNKIEAGRFHLPMTSFNVPAWFNPFNVAQSITPGFLSAGIQKITPEVKGLIQEVAHVQSMKGITNVPFSASESRIKELGRRFHVADYKNKSSEEILATLKGRTTFGNFRPYVALESNPYFGKPGYLKDETKTFSEWTGGIISSALSFGFLNTPRFLIRNIANNIFTQQIDRWSPSRYFDSWFDPSGPSSIPEIRQHLDKLGISRLGIGSQGSAADYATKPFLQQLRDAADDPHLLDKAQGNIASYLKNGGKLLFTPSSFAQTLEEGSMWRIISQAYPQALETLTPSTVEATYRSLRNVGVGFGTPQSSNALGVAELKHVVESPDPQAVTRFIEGLKSGKLPPMLEQKVLAPQTYEVASEQSKAAIASALNNLSEFRTPREAASLIRNEIKALTAPLKEQLQSRKLPDVVDAMRVQFAESVLAGMSRGMSESDALRFSASHLATQVNRAADNQEVLRQLWEYVDFAGRPDAVISWGNAAKAADQITRLSGGNLTEKVRNVLLSYVGDGFDSAIDDVVTDLQMVKGELLAKDLVQGSIVKRFNSFTPVQGAPATDEVLQYGPNGVNPLSQSAAPIKNHPLTFLNPDQQMPMEDVVLQLHPQNMLDVQQGRLPTNLKDPAAIEWLARNSRLGLPALAPTAFIGMDGEDDSPNWFLLGAIGAVSGGAYLPRMLKSGIKVGDQTFIPKGSKLVPGEPHFKQPPHHAAALESLVKKLDDDGLFADVAQIKGFPKLLEQLQSGQINIFRFTREAKALAPTSDMRHIFQQFGENVTKLKAAPDLVEGTHYTLADGALSLTQSGKQTLTSTIKEFIPYQATDTPITRFPEDQVNSLMDAVQQVTPQKASQGGHRPGATELKGIPTKVINALAEVGGIDADGNLNREVVQSFGRMVQARELKVAMDVVNPGAADNPLFLYQDLTQLRGLDAGDITKLDPHIRSALANAGFIYRDGSLNRPKIDRIYPMVQEALQGRVMSQKAGGGFSGDLTTTTKVTNLESGEVDFLYPKMLKEKSLFAAQVDTSLRMDEEELLRTAGTAGRVQLPLEDTHSLLYLASLSTNPVMQKELRALERAVVKSQRDGEPLPAPAQKMLEVSRRHWDQRVVEEGGVKLPDNNEVSPTGNVWEIQEPYTAKQGEDTVLLQAGLKELPHYQYEDWAHDALTGIKNRDLRELYENRIWGMAEGTPFKTVLQGYEDSINALNSQLSKLNVQSEALQEGAAARLESLVDQVTDVLSVHNLKPLPKLTGDHKKQVNDLRKHLVDEVLNQRGEEPRNIKAGLIGLAKGSDERDAVLAEHSILKPFFQKDSSGYKAWDLVDTGERTGDFKGELLKQRTELTDRYWDEVAEFDPENAEVVAALTNHVKMENAYYGSIQEKVTLYPPKGAPPEVRAINQMPRETVADIRSIREALLDLRIDTRQKENLEAIARYKSGEVLDELNEVSAEANVLDWSTEYLEKIDDVLARKDVNTHQLNYEAAKDEVEDLLERNHRADWFGASELLDPAKINAAPQVHPRMEPREARDLLINYIARHPDDTEMQDELYDRLITHSQYWLDRYHNMELKEGNTFADKGLMVALMADAQKNLETSKLGKEHTIQQLFKSLDTTESSIPAPMLGEKIKPTRFDMSEFTGSHNPTLPDADLRIVLPLPAGDTQRFLNEVNGVLQSRAKWEYQLNRDGNALVPGDYGSSVTIHPALDSLEQLAADLEASLSTRFSPLHLPSELTPSQGRGVGDISKEGDVVSQGDLGDDIVEPTASALSTRTLTWDKATGTYKEPSSFASSAYDWPIPWKENSSIHVRLAPQEIPKQLEEGTPSRELTPQQMLQRADRFDQNWVLRRLVDEARAWFVPEEKIAWESPGYLLSLIRAAREGEDVHAPLTVMEARALTKSSIKGVAGRLASEAKKLGVDTEGKTVREIQELISYVKQGKPVDVLDTVRGVSSSGALENAQVQHTAQMAQALDQGLKNLDETLPVVPGFKQLPLRGVPFDERKTGLGFTDASYGEYAPQMKQYGQIPAGTMGDPSLQNALPMGFKQTADVPVRLPSRGAAEPFPYELGEFAPTSESFPQVPVSKPVPGVSESFPDEALSYEDQIAEILAMERAGQGGSVPVAKASPTHDIPDEVVPSTRVPVLTPYIDEITDALDQGIELPPFLFNALQYSEFAKKVGIFDRVIELVAEGKTASQAVDVLTRESKLVTNMDKVDRLDLVRGIRSAVGVPQMASSTGMSMSTAVEVDPAAFASWQHGYWTKRGESGVPSRFRVQGQDYSAQVPGSSVPTALPKEIQAPPPAPVINPDETLPFPGEELAPQLDAGADPLATLAGKSEEEIDNALNMTNLPQSTIDQIYTQLDELQAEGAATKNPRITNAINSVVADAEEGYAAQRQYLINQVYQSVGLNPLPRSMWGGVQSLQPWNQSYQHPSGIGSQVGQALTDWYHGEKVIKGLGNTAPTTKLPAGVNQEQLISKLQDHRQRLIQDHRTALDIAKRASDVALHNYSNKNDADALLRWIIPWHFWTTRSVLKYGERMLDRPWALGRTANLFNAVQGSSGDGSLPGDLQSRLNNKIALNLLPGVEKYLPEGTISTDPRRAFFPLDMLGFGDSPLEYQQQNKDLYAQERQNYTDLGKTLMGMQQLTGSLSPLINYAMQSPKYDHLLYTGEYRKYLDERGIDAITLTPGLQIYNRLLLGAVNGAGVELGPVPLTQITPRDTRLAEKVLLGYLMQGKLSPDEAKQASLDLKKAYGEPSIFGKWGKLEISGWAQRALDEAQQRNLWHFDGAGAVTGITMTSVLPGEIAHKQLGDKLSNPDIQRMAYDLYGSKIGDAFIYSVGDIVVDRNDKGEPITIKLNPDELSKLFIQKATAEAEKSPEKAASLIQAGKQLESKLPGKADWNADWDKYISGFMLDDSPERLALSLATSEYITHMNAAKRRELDSPLANIKGLFGDEPVERQKKIDGWYDKRPGVDAYVRELMRDKYGVEPQVTSAMDSWEEFYGSKIEDALQVKYFQDQDGVIAWDVWERMEGDLLKLVPQSVRGDVEQYLDRNTTVEKAARRAVLDLTAESRSLRSAAFKELPPGPERDLALKKAEESFKFPDVDELVQKVLDARPSWDKAYIAYELTKKDSDDQGTKDLIISQLQQNPSSIKEYIASRLVANEVPALKDLYADLDKEQERKLLEGGTDRFRMPNGSVVESGRTWTDINGKEHKPSSNVADYLLAKEYVQKRDALPQETRNTSSIKYTDPDAVKYEQFFGAGTTAARILGEIQKNFAGRQEWFATITKREEEEKQGIRSAQRTPFTDAQNKAKRLGDLLEEAYEAAQDPMGYLKAASQLNPSAVKTGMYPSPDALLSANQVVMGEVKLPQDDRKVVADFAQNTVAGSWGMNLEKNYETGKYEAKVRRDPTQPLPGYPRVAEKSSNGPSTRPRTTYQRSNRPYVPFETGAKVPVDAIRTLLVKDNQELYHDNWTEIEKTVRSIYGTKEVDSVLGEIRTKWDATLSTPDAAVRHLKQENLLKQLVDGFRTREGKSIVSYPAGRYLVTDDKGTERALPFRMNDEPGNALKGLLTADRMTATQDKWEKVSDYVMSLYGYAMPEGAETDQYTRDIRDGLFKTTWPEINALLELARSSWVTEGEVKDSALRWGLQGATIRKMVDDLRLKEGMNALSKDEGLSTKPMVDPHPENLPSKLSYSFVQRNQDFRSVQDEVMESYGYLNLANTKDNSVLPLQDRQYLSAQSWMRFERAHPEVAKLLKATEQIWSGDDAHRTEVVTNLLRALNPGATIERLSGQPFPQQRSERRLYYNSQGGIAQSAQPRTSYEFYQDYVRGRIPMGSSNQVPSAPQYVLPRPPNPIIQRRGTRGYRPYDDEFIDSLG